LHGLKITKLNYRICCLRKWELQRNSSPMKKDYGHHKQFL
jgi:hypothetical protein